MPLKKQTHKKSRKYQSGGGNPDTYCDDRNKEVYKPETPGCRSNDIPTNIFNINDYSVPEENRIGQNNRFSIKILDNKMICTNGELNVYKNTHAYKYSVMHNNIMRNANNIYNIYCLVKENNETLKENNETLKENNKMLKQLTKTTN